MQTVSDCFAAEHEHLERRLAALAAMLLESDVQDAQRETEGLAIQLLEHLHEEEEKVFPALASRLSMVRPTAELTREHRQIEAGLRDLSEAVAAGLLVDAHRCVEDLLPLLEAHHRRELKELYSWADALAPEACARLMRRLGHEHESV
jgi:hypothetical protein